MNSAEVEANAQAAFAMELASSAALQALCTIASKEVVRMAWLLGHCQGRLHAFEQVRKEFIHG